MNGRIALVITLAASSLGAQQATQIRVRNDQGQPIAFAVIAIGSANSKVADSLGVLPVRVAGADSLMLHVRRIGHVRFDGWVRRASDGGYIVQLKRVVASLDTVRVTEREITPLETRGFYDRMQRVQRGAIVGEFLTPEQLDFRNSQSISGILLESRYARIMGAPGGRSGRVKLITGRGGCRMTILVDDQKMRGTAQDVGNGGLSREGDPNISVDDVMGGAEVMAVEVYPSTANAPAELQTLSGRGDCGIVALWTGARK